MGYEGDTCSFTCNTGYELTGNGTRTCQRDGSWSGSDGSSSGSGGSSSGSGGSSSGSDDVCRRGTYANHYAAANGYISVCNLVLLLINQNYDLASYILYYMHLQQSIKIILHPSYYIFSF